MTTNVNKERSLDLLADTGRVTLAFVSENMKVYIISNDFRNRWPSHVLRESRATLFLEGRKRMGKAGLITSPGKKDEIMKLFRDKYGEAYTDHYFRNPSRFIEIDTSSLPLREKDGYYGWLEDEFDNIAEEYDRHIFGNRVNSLLRERSVALMRRTFIGRKRLLEIGFGTGTETLELLRDGHEITATDISTRMIDQLRRKVKEEGLSEQLSLHRARAGRISEVLSDGERGVFDGIYSNFGALNCEENLGDISPQIWTLLTDKGPFVSGVYNRYCMSEILLYMLTFQPGKVHDRMRRHSMEGHSRFCVDIFSYGPSEFFSFFRKYFLLRSVEGVPVIIPPSNLVDYVEKFSSHFTVLKKLDRTLGALWPFKYLGDHFLMVMQKK